MFALKIYKTYFISIVVIIATMLFCSCATFTNIGVGRVKHYTLSSERLPQSFDSMIIAFVSDMHYPSKFTRKRLSRVVNELNRIKPDVLLLGGDYITSDEYAFELFDSVSSVQTEYGIYAVFGNHENRRKEIISAAMEKNSISLLADKSVSLSSHNDTLCIAGVADSFGADTSFLDSIPDNRFTILLSHTPDYAQNKNVDADVVLSGHTHGGQVSFLGVVTPVKNTLYGNRFLRGLNYTDTNIPVITTNGVGTSRCNIRFCVPSEIVIVVLRSMDK